jgi:hypothetical protein
MVHATVTMGKEIAVERMAVVTGNETVNAAFMSLAEGPRFELRLFHSLFATKDQKKGGCRSDPVHALP